MNILEEIQNCPVEWNELGEVCDVKAGKNINKTFIQNNLGNFPVINSGKEPLGYINIFNTKNDPIGITSRGAGVGYVSWNEGKYFRGNLNYSATVQDEKVLLPRFLYFYLKNSSQEIENLCTFDGIPALNKSALEGLLIPIPPLKIQEKIVQILDKMIEYIMELTSELTSRKKQYSFYRDRLLNFEENTHQVKWKTLGKIGKVSMCKRILKSQTSEDGEIPFYKIGTFGRVATSYISRELFEDYKLKYSYPKVGDILISASGTIGRTVVFNGEDSYFQDSNIVWLNNDESQVLNRYLYYFYQMHPWKVSDGGTINRLYNRNIEETRIPVPSFEIQARIVQILDNFDTVCNDLNIGLPKEIELRQKQYEYWRDRLLDFNKKEKEL